MRSQVHEEWRKTQDGERDQEWGQAPLLTRAASEGTGLPNIPDVLLAVLATGAPGMSGKRRPLRITAPGLLGALARWFILLFAVLAAVTQLGIAQSMIFILFASALGMVALAGGLAFGLGGRETASQIVNNWHSRNQQAAPQLMHGTAQRQQQVSGGYSTPQTARYTTTDPASQQDMSRQS